MDHPWHEYGDVMGTDELFDDERTITQFLEQVEAVEKWNELEVAL
jgi:hypothetical protein